MTGVLHSFDDAGLMNLLHIAANIMPTTSSTGHPLGDAIQLDGDCQCLLVTDTIEADGRFILCHLAAKHCSSAGALWLACGADDRETTVRSAIRRLDGSGKTSVSVQSIPKLLKERYFSDEIDDPIENISSKQVLQMIRDWRPTVKEGNPLVVIDDISTLSALIGEREAYLLAYGARGLSFDLDFSLIVRALGTDTTSFHLPIDYFGAGGGTSRTNMQTEGYWESGLAELADQTVDVRPLASGYSRDAQGRFFVTDAQRDHHVYNYLLLDNEVRVFRKN